MNYSDRIKHPNKLIRILGYTQFTGIAVTIAYLLLGFLISLLVTFDPNFSFYYLDGFGLIFYGFAFVLAISALFFFLPFILIWYSAKSLIEYLEKENPTKQVDDEENN